jgi:tetratricopeptide (TPR) repeat protein
VLYHRDRPAEAEPFLRDALEIVIETRGPDHPQAGTTLNVLSAVLKDLNRLDEASEALHRSLAVFRKAHPGDHPNIAISIHNLGRLEHLRGRTDEALNILDQALAMHRRLFGENHPTIATCLFSIADVRAKSGRVETALEPAEAALAIRRKVLTDRHPDVAASLYQVAHLRHANGKTDAEPLLTECLRIPADALPAAHPPRCKAAGLLGSIRTAAGDFSAAEGLLLEAEQSASAITGFAAADREESWSRLVALYQAWETADPGRGFGERAVPWRERLASVKQPAGDQTGPR